jgi:hypothetical protein
MLRRHFAYRNGRTITQDLYGILLNQLLGVIDYFVIIGPVFGPNRWSFKLRNCPFIPMGFELSPDNPVDKDTILR